MLVFLFIILCYNKQKQHFIGGLIMYIRNKADFNNYLKKAQKDSYYARQVSDILSKGDNSIGVKKDLKKAIKICQYWEKKKDYTGEKQYFL